MPANEKGFTLLEVIIVMAVLAMFAAMAVPLTGRTQDLARVRETERRLEMVREAMLGPKGSVDAAGRRLLAGYAGDLGGLPPLRRSVWDNALQRWEWPGETFANEQEAERYWATGMGQPQNLWAPLPPLLPEGATDPLAARWRGPYLHEPRDEFPANAERMRWTSAEGLLGLTAAQHRLAEATNREIEMRQTAGRLADAWGRSLLFFYVRPGAAGAVTFQGLAEPRTTLYIVSEGTDLKSTHPAFDRALPGNRDNLVLAVTPQEWRDDFREAETRRLLQAVLEALVGRWGPADRLGRPLFGGYIGDHGRWPTLFVWQGTPAPWRAVTEADAVLGAVYGQPRGLWTQDVDGDGNLVFPPDLPPPPDPGPAGRVLLGFGWRGPYLPRPVGTGEGEVLRDAWGVPLEFRLTDAFAHDPSATQTLTIRSAGPDGRLQTADDLTETVPRHFDVRREFILEGTVVNETGLDRQLGVRLHASPANRPTVLQQVYGRGTVLGQVYGNTWQFSFPVSRSSAGPRLLELFGEEGGIFRRFDWTTVHIGSGGTAASERVPLVLRASP